MPISGRLPCWLDAADARIAAWMDRHCLVLMRISLALVFLWFGALKPLGLSPEEELIKRTVYWLPPASFIPILGWWEVAIGVGLLHRPLIRGALFLLLVQLPGTMLPLLLLPEVCFTSFPLAPTLEGQYIIKNLFLVSAAFVLGGKVRHQEAGSAPVVDHALPFADKAPWRTNCDPAVPKPGA